MPAAIDSLPILHSNPEASKTLYLNFLGNEITEDFDGDLRNFKGLVTHTFDFDGDPTQFSGSEQAAIREIWSIVAEDFAPFDINVTTQYSGSFDDGLALNVAIGGTTRDAELTSGLAPLPLGSFTNAAPNTVLVVPTNIAFFAKKPVFDVADRIGNTVSHEAGHAFGLEHDRDIPSPIRDYDNGTEFWTPIMGNNLSTDRHTWSRYESVLDDGEGVLIESRTLQSDNLAALASVLGLRADDHADAGELATPMIEINPGLSFEQSGIIGTMDDKDVFSFQVKHESLYRIRVDVPQFGNLDAKFTLFTAEGSVLIVDGHFADGILDEQFDLILSPDTQYFVQVESHGAYGDLGQYAVSVTWLVGELGPFQEPPIAAIPQRNDVDPLFDLWINPELNDSPDILDLLADGEMEQPPAWESDLVQSPLDVLIEPDVGSLLNDVESLVVPADMAALDASVLDTVLTQSFSSTFQTVSGSAARFRL